MITFSIIQKSQIEGAHRLDAEYYQPEYLELENNLKKFGNKLKLFGESLENGNSLTGGATPLGADYPESGIKFLRVQNIMPGYLDFSDIVFIDEKIHKGQLKRSKLIDGDVLLTITGVSYGKSAVYKSEFGEANINQHSVKMHFNKNLIPEYAAMFLNSKYGKFQSDRKITGNTRPALAYEEIKEYKIPTIDISLQKEIKIICDESASEDKKAIELYSKAGNLLLEELGLKDFDTEENLSSIVNLSDVKSAGRMDAEYFQPKYSKLIEKLKNPKPLDKIARRRKGIVKIDTKKDYKYIEISDVNVGSGEINYNTLSARELPANAKIKIDGGELIVSKVRPTRGAVGIIPDD